MNKYRRQLILFEEASHLELDYFISGDPWIPDILEVEYRYYNDFEKLGEPVVALAEVIPLFPKEPNLRLCEPPEKGWEIA